MRNIQVRGAQKLWSHCESRKRLKRRIRLEKYRRYLTMEETEFLEKYTRVKAKYEQYRVAIGVPWITVLALLSALLYCYVSSIRRDLQGTPFSLDQLETMIHANVVVAVILFGCTCLLIGLMEVIQYKSTKERIWIEEVKKRRKRTSQKVEGMEGDG